MTDFIDKIAEDNDLYIVNLNSNSAKDIDIAVFTWESKRPVTKIINILRLAEGYIDEMDFYCKNVDYPKLSDDKPKFHLLLYPTVEYFQLFEPPSLIRHLQKHSKIQKGDIHKFGATISNLDTKQIRVANKTILQYLEQSLNNLFYLLLNTDLFSTDEYTYNLTYLSKYFRIERERLISGNENFELKSEINIPSDKEYCELKSVLIQEFENLILQMEKTLIES